MTIADDVEIKPAHLRSGMNREWYWGWVAIDRHDGLAVGVLTAYYIDYFSPPYAGVHIVHARRHRGLGVHLLTTAKRELAGLDPPIVLYRSGTATPQGRDACLRAGLDLDPRIEAIIARAQRTWVAGPKQTLTTGEALEMGRRHLEAAAQMLGVEPIPPKVPEVSMPPELGAAE
ncbi:hypothetical protein ACFWFQ_26545 [Nocardia salmonicida]|uniref:hypothetical protein n=1 Tax=Nocardia salmonicida TaxID=53431 RepID=UPI0036531DEE